MKTRVKTITLAGQRFVILPEAEYRRLQAGKVERGEPSLPERDGEGNYPAVEAARVVLARKLIRQRRAAGLSQVELARRAGVRVETVNRLEHTRHSPNVATVDKFVRAMEAARREQGE